MDGQDEGDVLLERGLRGWPVPAPGIPREHCFARSRPFRWSERGGAFALGLAVSAPGIPLRSCCARPRPPYAKAKGDGGFLPAQE